MSSPASDSTIRINPTMYAIIPIVIFIYHHQPRHRTSAKLSETFINKQVLKDLIDTLNTHSCLQSLFVCLRTASRSELGRFPSSIHKNLSSVSTTRRIEGNLLVLRIGDTCFNPSLSVVSLVDLVTLIDTPRSIEFFQLFLQLCLTITKHNAKLKCFIHIKDKAITFLLSHNPSNLMLKINSFQRILLSTKLVVELLGDYNVLPIVGKHLVTEVIPSILLFTIGTLKLT